ncbi:hypothetical protein E4K72_06315 [Oxalobacteraceae bacterium OM1]|nr:hypothetical protein E4K72_06315 [Oxalobacteraceae bacterium OM1]
MHPAFRHTQRGATLVVGLILLAVITLTVTAAFTMSGTNLKSVGNMQFRNEAVAAANMAIEQVLSSPFTTTASTDEISVDINNDGTYDYTVAVDRPACVRASAISTTSSGGNGSSTELGIAATPTYWYTIWDITATVKDPSSGTSVVVHQGVRASPMDDTQRNLVCP